MPGGAIGEECLADIQVPIGFLAVAREHACQCLILSFDDTVALRVVCRGEVMLNSVIAGKLRNFMVLEVRSLVGLEMRRATESWE